MFNTGDAAGIPVSRSPDVIAKKAEYDKAMNAIKIVRATIKKQCQTIRLLRAQHNRQKKAGASEDTLKQTRVGAAVLQARKNRALKDLAVWTNEVNRRKYDLASARRVASIRNRKLPNVDLVNPTPAKAFSDYTCGFAAVAKRWKNPFMPASLKTVCNEGRSKYGKRGTFTGKRKRTMRKRRKGRKKRGRPMKRRRNSYSRKRYLPISFGHH